jgi:uncharacterized protein
MRDRDTAVDTSGIPECRGLPRVTLLTDAAGANAANLDGLHRTVLSDKEVEGLGAGALSAATLTGGGRWPTLEEKFVQLRLRKTPSLSSSAATSESINHENAHAPLELAVLHVTDYCNLHCTYCYAATSRAGTMPKTVARAAIDRLAAMPPRGPIRLEFHGGEPLLAWGLVRWAVAYASRFRLPNGAPRFSFSIQTNGTLLDEARILFLKEHDFSVGVSFDGPRARHDTYRVHRDGRGSFDEAIRGLKLLEDGGVRHGVICVVTDPAVLDDFPDVMLDCGFRHVAFNHLLCGQGRSKGQIAPTAAAVFGEKMLDLADRVIDYNLTTWDNGFVVRNLSVLVLNILSKARSFMCMRIPCGAGASLIGIAPDGSVYPCKEMADSPELLVGNVVDSSIEELLSHPLCVQLRARRAQSIEDCAECYARDVCEVSCPSRSYHLGSTFLLKTELCEYYRTVVPGLLWRIHESPHRILQLV